LWTTSYIYNAPIVALNPNYPTPAARLVIYYNIDSYRQYLTNHNETEIELVNPPNPLRDVQCYSIRCPMLQLRYDSNNVNAEHRVGTVARLRLRLKRRELQISFVFILKIQPIVS